MNISAEQNKIVKHRSTIAPFECAHCGYIWYGYATGNKLMPGVIICTRCWLELDNYIWKEHKELYHAEGDEGCNIAHEWVQDKTKNPLPRSAEKRFHRSVPKWIRTAIASGMMRTDSQDAYVIYSRDGVALKAEIVDRSSLKPFKIR